MSELVLLQAIDSKIKVAEDYLPKVLETLHRLGLKTTHRIKDRKRVLDKITRWKNRPDNQKSELELLQAVNDIVGITVIVDNVEETGSFVADLRDELYKKEQFQALNFIDHVNDGGGITGYKCFLVAFVNPVDGIPFEIQITDLDNLAIRESTHDEFVKEKYGSITRPKQFKPNK